MTDSDRSARLSAVSTNFRLAVQRAQELERSGTRVCWLNEVWMYGSARSPLLFLCC